MCVWGILKNNRYRALKRWVFEVVMAKDKLEIYIFQINMATEANTLNIQKAFVKYRAPKKDGRCEQTDSSEG